MTNNDPRSLLATSPMSTLQIIVCTITVFLNALDGFDLLAISFATPGIMKEFHIPPSTGLGLVISMDLAGKAMFNYSSIPPDVAVQVQGLRALCDAHGAELRAAALQFVAAHPLVVSVIPGAISVEEVEANVSLLETPIPAALWADLKSQRLIHPAAPV